jgi:hypothetical protein
MGIGITAIGTLRTPDRERTFEQVADLAGEFFAPFFAGARIAEDHALLSLFPNAEELTITIDEEGAVELEARTTPVGVGYHMLCCVYIQALADQLGFAWTEVSDDTDFFSTKDDAHCRDEFIGWSRGIAETMSGDKFEGHANLAVCMGIGERFHYPEFVVTPFGPATREEMEERARSGEAAAAWMPWMDPAPTAETLLAAAKSLMWCNVRWRQIDPEDAPDAEGPPHRAMLQALDLLEAAYELDPDLDYPWHEWLELLECSGEDREIHSTVDARAAATPEPESPIGYRRHDVTVPLPFGATIQLPGDLTWMLTDEAWVAAGGSASVQITPYTLNDEAAPRSASVLLEQAWDDLMTDVDADAAGDPFEWSADRPDLDQVGRAAHYIAREDDDAESSDGFSPDIEDADADGDDDSSDGPTYITQGLIATRGTFLLCTLLYTDEDDRAWAEDCLKSIEFNVPLAPD